MMLKSFNIELIADIRSLPGSRKYPQFDKENLEIELPKNNILYKHFPNLGGRRKVNKDSPNTSWRNDAFRGYADYMETDAFENAIKELEQIALKQRTCYMCAEAVWWQCHRSMVSDYLKAKKWKVYHIMNIGKAQEHCYTQPARIIGDKVVYTESNLFEP
ncbi:MAG TPA: DUF488 domain-containing protein [Chitinophagales bacterium]|nr:DUF488 domain-containing protein [Chitinophagales bacterium]HMV02624.1 DUF488 domain-containing protein [Chitinophagales bacterium]HMW94440.1 DUF488 domain-containing protein [Chitinophagales bacterium]HMY41497.1 DUF488 domain-containing protein [Chitinophagales bacterium]HMZ68699.1 DUF488 domain-containing protein [Chitinophagales bacterium]